MAEKVSTLAAAACEEQLFAVALRLPAGTRPTLLEAVGADAPQIRQRLEALLKAHAEAGNLLDSPSKAADANPSP